MNLPARPYWVNHETAIKLFEAYHRIVVGSPLVVPGGARLTLALVAAEAGFQRSTLTRKRYPELCAMIDEHGASTGRATSATQKLAQKARANRELQDEIRSLKAQRDDILSRYVSLGAAYIELDARARRLEEQLGAPSKVRPIRGSAKSQA